MPATSGAIRAGRAYVELLLRDGSLINGLKKAGMRLKTFGTMVGSMGLRATAAMAGATAALAATSTVYANAGDRLAKMSERTGLSVEALSELDYAASQSGSSLEGLEAGLKRMQRTVYDAGRGLSTAVDGLNDLGLSVADLKGLTPDQQFNKIAAALGNVSDASRKAALAQVIFGSSGTALLPMLVDGSKGLRELYDEAHRLGLTWTREDAYAAVEFGDRMDDLWKVVKMGVVQIGASLAPTLRALGVQMTKIIVSVNAWITKHRDLVVTIFKVVAAGTAAAAVIAGLGFAIAGLGYVLLGVSAVLTGIVSVIAAIISPIGLLIAGVVTLGATLVTSSGLGRAAFAALYSVVSSVIGGITDALAAGDIKLAAQIFWAGLQVAWQTGIAFLDKLWQNFKLLFMNVLLELLDFFGINAKDFFAAWANVTHGMEVAWINTVAFLKTLWTGFKSWYFDTIDAIASKLAEPMIKAQATEFITDRYGGKLSKDRAAELKRFNGLNVSAGDTLTPDQMQSLIADEIERQEANKQQSLDKGHNARDQQYMADAAKTEAERQKALQDEKTKFDAALAKINSTKDFYGAAQDQRNAAVAADQDAVDAAKTHLQDLLDQAKRERAGNNKAAPAAVQAAQASVQSAFITDKAAGTFNPLAISDLARDGGVKDSLEKLVKGQDKANGYLRNIADDSGGVPVGP